MESNPYSSNPSQETTPSYQTQGADPLVVNLLQRTGGWMRLCAIMGLLGSVLFFIGAIGSLATLLRGNSNPLILTNIVTYLIAAIFYIYPSMKLSRSATAIRKLTSSGSSQDLIQALDQQRKFWKFVGVVTVVSIVLGFGLGFVGVSLARFL